MRAWDAFTDSGKDRNHKGVSQVHQEEWVIVKAKQIMMDILKKANHEDHERAEQPKKIKHR